MSTTRRTRQQVERWARANLPDQLEHYGEDLLDWLYPARRHRGWVIAFVVLMIAGILGGVAAAVLAARNPDA